MRGLQIVALAAGIFVSPLVAAWITVWLRDRPFRQLARDIDRAKAIAQRRRA